MIFSFCCYLVIIHYSKLTMMTDDNSIMTWGWVNVEYNERFNRIPRFSIKNSSTFIFTWSILEIHLLFLFLILPFLVIPQIPVGTYISAPCTVVSHFFIPSIQLRTTYLPTVSILKMLLSSSWSLKPTPLYLGLALWVLFPFSPICSHVASKSTINVFSPPVLHLRRFTYSLFS